MSECVGTEALSNENNLVIKNKRGNKATKCQIRNRISLNNKHLIKWFKMQANVNKLVRYEYEWRNMYYLKISQIMSKDTIIALKRQTMVKPTSERSSMATPTLEFPSTVKPALKRI
jgi:hypothetical protein